jgi:hypothetical protein
MTGEQFVGIEAEPALSTLILDLRMFDGKMRRLVVPAPIGEKKMMTSGNRTPKKRMNCESTMFFQSLNIVKLFAALLAGNR